MAVFRVFQLLSMTVILVLLAQVNAAPNIQDKGNVSLELTDINHLEAQLSCRLDYSGDMTGVSAEVLVGPDVCLNTLNPSDYRTYCGLHILKSEDPGYLQFSVPVNGSCGKDLTVRCKFYKMFDGKILWDNEDLRLVPVRGDRPVIIVDERVEAHKLTRITCIATNMCNKAELKMKLPEEQYMRVNTTLISTGSGFNITTTYQTVFDTPASYDVSCEVKGEHNIYSGNYSLEVHSQLMDPYFIAFFSMGSVGAVLAITAVLYSAGFIETLLMPRHKKIDLLLRAFETKLNVEKAMRYIQKILDKGEIKLPETQPSLVMRWIKVAVPLLQYPSYVEILTGLLPSDAKSSQKERLAAVLLEKLEIKGLTFQELQHLIEILKIMKSHDDKIEISAFCRSEEHSPGASQACCIDFGSKNLANRNSAEKVELESLLKRSRRSRRSRRASDPGFPTQSSDNNCNHRA